MVREIPSADKGPESGGAAGPVEAGLFALLLLGATVVGAKCVLDSDKFAQIKHGIVKMTTEPANSRSPFPG